ncbi:MAG: hypothetical protein ACRDVN_06815 [Jiangellaceae bacterium]
MTEQGPPDSTDSGPDQVTGTGDARIDTALAALEGLDRASVHEHAAVVEEVHRSLQDALADEDG